MSGAIVTEPHGWHRGKPAKSSEGCVYPTWERVPPKKRKKTTRLSKPLRHFIDLASRGKQAGASKAEKRAWRIAYTLMAALPGIGDEAIEGCAEFVLLANNPKAGEIFGIK